MASVPLYHRFKEFGSTCTAPLLQTVTIFCTKSSIFRTEKAATDLNVAQSMILSFLHGLFTEDFMLCTLLIQMSSSVEQLKSSYLKQWLKDDYVFDREDVAKALKVFERLVSQIDIDAEVPVIWVTIFSGLAEKYQVYDFQAVSSSLLQQEDGEDAINMRLCTAVQNNSAAEILAAAVRGGNINMKTTSGDSLYHLTVKHSYMESIAALGYLKADIEVMDAEMITPVQRAVLCNNSEAVMALAAAGANLNRRMKGGDSLVHFAITNGCNKALEALMKTSADLNVENYDGEIPITLAMKRLNVKTVQILLENNTDPNIITDGESLLHLACSLKNVDIVRMLLRAGAKSDTQNKAGLLPIHISQDKEIIETLVSCGASVDGKSSSGDTALHLSVSQGNLNTIQFLIISRAVVDSRNNTGETPLMLAASCGSAEIVQLLLSNGADPNAKDNEGITAAHKAADCGNLMILKFLEGTGADLRVTTTNGDTILHMAASKANFDFTEYIINAGAAVDSRNKKEETPLMLAASSANADNVRLLLANGADPNTKDNKRKTTAHKAAEGGSLVVLQMLKGAGADLTRFSDDGFNVFHTAAINGHAEVVNWLLTSEVGIILNVSCTFSNWEYKYNNGTSLFQQILTGPFHWTALHLSCLKGHLSVVKALLASGSCPNVKDNHSLTPLHLAAYSANVAVVKELLDNKCDVKAKSIQNLAACHIAANQGHLEILKLILENGASIDEPGCMKWTPLHIAAASGNLDMTWFLLDKGANINSVNEYPVLGRRSPGSHTPLVLANFNKQTAVVDLLKSRGGN